MTDLSVLIPARNEMFLPRTIQDLLEHIEADTEIVAVMDGYEIDIPPDPRLTVLHFPESIGQRAVTNAAARVARGRYVMKVDGHCAFDQGFDRIMIEDMEDDITMAPLMRNLHAFDWVCEDGHRRYQGPSGPCTECGKPTTMDVVWIAKPSPQSTAYRFDRTLHFQYWNDYKSQQKGDLVETMSLQGSAFMMTKDRYFDLNICDESWGSWGQQGVEVAVKSWLSGGRVLVNKRTWYAHMFRTQGGDFGFPYPISGKQVDFARKKSREVLQANNWDKAIHPFEWMLEKFAPIPDWNVSKGIVYYTDNQLDPAIMKACQEQLVKSVNGHRVISVSLGSLPFAENIALEMERGYLAMFKQILAGLEALQTDIVFLAEHDMLYHPSHFQFVPLSRDCFYYNTNVWKVRYSDGHALHYDCKQTSGLCAYRDLMIEHYRQRVANTEAALLLLGNTHNYRNWIRKQGFEPGTHGRAERVDNHKSDAWQSEYPNIDIRHDKNLTPSRWRQEDFRNKKYCAGWTEAEEVPGWGHIDSGYFTGDKK